MHKQTVSTVRRRRLAWAWLLAALAVAALSVACGPGTLPVAQPTPDYHALETRVEAMLRATYTALAPPATPTPPPTETFTPTPEPATPVATVTPPANAPRHDLNLAYVQRGTEGESNIVLEGILPENRVVLSRLAGQDLISDLAWSPDGEWLLFVSGYSALLSRDNERNLFMVRTDGTGLRMITGEHVAADKAPGPYVSLEGRVVGAEGDCLVSAQGVSGPALLDAAGSFRIPGVPVGATWARAICVSDGRSLAGDVTIAAENGVFAPTLIELAEGGQGWRQASLSQSGTVLAGTYYRWGPEELAAVAETTGPDDTAAPPNDVAPDAAEAESLGDALVDDQATIKYQFWGRIVGLESGYQADLEAVQQGDLNGVDWSPTSDVLVGALTGGDGGWLWLWDASGASVGELFQMPNPDDQILTLANPAWSPDGSQVVFEVRRWYWWGEDGYATDLMLVSGDGQTIQPLVKSAWGEHATSPGWMPDGSRVVYQYSRTPPGQDLARADNGAIWMVEVATGQRLPWSSGPADYAPAPNPVGDALTVLAAPSPTATATAAAE